MKSLVVNFIAVFLLIQVHGQALPRNFRFIYNSDGDNMYLFDANTPEKLYPYVDEVAEVGVTSFFICPNVGMTKNYPTKVSDRVGVQPMSKATYEALPDWSKRMMHNINALIANGHDPFRILVERAKARGMEVFATYRLNEVHAVDKPESYHFSAFWKAHPEWRIGQNGDYLSPVYLDILGPDTHPIVAGWLPGGLNFAVPEVRAFRLQELEELCVDYDIDGLELDFQRFPMYFKVGEEAGNVETMTDWIAEVRAMVDSVAEKRGRPLLLSTRIMAKPEQNQAIGLDPIAWANRKLIDFMTVAHYLQNSFPLPISDYREMLPDRFPLYASIEVEKTIADYQRVAEHLWSEAVDGVVLFNFPSSRENGIEPPFDRIRDIGYPPNFRNLGSANETN